MGVVALPPEHGRNRLPTFKLSWQSTPSALTVTLTASITRFGTKRRISEKEEYRRYRVR
jgi:hypothetical protein